jgi:diguanylate cyclase (GGDEF)-like protein/PAS domain S-box-containing protein
MLARPRVGTLVHVLLVEDNDGDARLVEIMLQDTLGPDVKLSRARTLSEALNVVSAHPPDCVLLDLGLPDAQGLEGVRLIKSVVPMVAVVVLTGEADGAIGTEAVEAGAQDYLVKGNTRDETLSRSIRYAIVRKHAEDALVRSQQTLAEAQRIARVGSWELDFSSNSMVWSVEMCRLYGYPPEPAPTTADFLRRFHPDDKEALQALLRSAIGARSSFDIDHRIVLPDGSIRWMHSQGRVESAGASAPTRMCGTAQDITEQKAADDALTYQALHDALTGLPNRTVFLDRLKQALVKLGRSASSVGVLFIDIDRFKVINDSMGHPAGDQLLIAMSHRLEGAIRPGDTLARFGGDEFAILCEDLWGEGDALEIADRIGQAMAQPLSCGDGELVVTVSTGIALASSPLVSAVNLLRDADAAMYRAKENGRARSAVFAESMHAKAVGRLDTEVALRRAISSGELETHYQPIVDLPSGTLVGMEALVRWRHPTRGLIGPDQFIGIAEETGLIVPLGEWVLRDAVRQTCLWRLRTGCSNLKIAVNLSAAQIGHPNLVAIVAAVLDETGLPPQSLQLEITESVLMHDAPAAVKILRALKSLGAGLSIDDFGTGYSSLSYLKRFPIDTLKIDRSFVDGLGDDPEASAIVRAILSLAEALNLTAIAEGVETDLQLHHLIDLHCSFGQGYHIARPATVADLDGWLERQGSSTGRINMPVYRPT